MFNRGNNMSLFTQFSSKAAGMQWFQKRSATVVVLIRFREFQSYLDAFYAKKAKYFRPVFSCPVVNPVLL